jgi:hypothetical protein
MQDPAEAKKPRESGGAGDSDQPANREGVLVHKDFSAYNREIRDQIDPDTQERVLLLTRKQWRAKLRKELRDVKKF